MIDLTTGRVFARSDLKANEIVMPKPLVYVASPYTKGDQAINVNYQCRMFDAMMNDGIVIPIVPLWSHFQHTICPRHYQDWIDYDLAIISRCDALIRLNA